jgi:hypothetical protein
VISVIRKATIVVRNMYRVIDPTRFSLCRRTGA